MQKRNAIASEHLEVAKQQLEASVALVQIERMRLESQMRVEHLQLVEHIQKNEDRFKTDYKDIFVHAQGENAALGLFLHHPIYALALLGTHVKSLYDIDKISIDLSVDIAIVMLHASHQEQKSLVKSFAREYLIRLNASGTFHDALNDLLDKIEQRVVDAEVKR